MNFKRPQFQLTFSLFSIALFIRLVVTPLLIHASGPDYRALSYFRTSQESASWAMFLMSYEAVIASIFFLLIATAFNKVLSSSAPWHNSTSISGSKTIYSTIAFIGVLAILIWGIPSGALNFFSIRGDSVDTDRSSVEMLSIQVMVIGAWLSFLLVSHHQAIKYRFHPSLRSVLVSLAVGILLVMLVFGDRRSVQLYTGLAVGTVLFSFFPDRKKTVFFAILGAVAAVIVALSVWRMFERHDIEIATTVFASSPVESLATALQSYFGGPYQVAAANDLLQEENLGFKNLVYDFARSTFLVNFFVEPDGMLSSQLLNDNIYDGKFLTGWIVFTTSYGYVLLGSVFSPLFLVLNIAIAMATEAAMRRARGAEVKFLFTYLFARMAAFPFSATPMLISFYSLQLFTAGLVFFAAILLKGIDRPFAVRSFSR